MQGLLGKKIGMTRVFDETGKVNPVTVIECGPCPVVQVKTEKNDGYDALQIGYGDMKDKNVGKPMSAHYKKAGVKPKRILKEIKGVDVKNIKLGQELTVDMFTDIKYVDVVGLSKGRGFAGTIKRHNFSRGRETHGSRNHRAPGSIGGHSYPARVWPGKKLPGHYGSATVTIRNLSVISVDKEKNVIMVKGAIPGHSNGYIFVREAIASTKG